MGICCFSCAQKAAEIFHIREMLYKKRESGLGFAGRKTTAMTIATTKSSLCFPHWWELLVYSLPVAFRGCVLHLQVKKHLPIWPWHGTGSSSPLGTLCATKPPVAVGPARLHHQCKSRAGGVCAGLLPGLASVGLGNPPSCRGRMLGRL